MRKKTVRSAIAFYLTLALIAVCALAALFVGMNHLRSYLAQYEKSQPQGVSEQVFTSLFKPGNAEELITRCNITQSRYDPPQSLETMLNGYLSGTLTSRCTSRRDDSVRYRVYSGDTCFAVYTLVPAPQGSDSFWELGELTLEYETIYRASVEIPQGMTAYCNGIELTPGCITAERKTASCAHMPPESTLSGLVYVTYTVEDLLTEPAITVKDASGADMQVEKDPATGLYYVPAPTADEVLREPNERQVFESAEALSIYALGDSSIAYPRKFLLPECDLYVNIESTKLKDVPAHFGYTFENEQTSEYMAYSEDVFSCRVQYDHVLRNVTDPDADPLYHYDLMCYFTVYEGTAVIYDMTVYGAESEAGEAAEEGGTVEP